MKLSRFFRRNGNKLPSMVCLVLFTISASAVAFASSSESINIPYPYAEDVVVKRVSDPFPEAQSRFGWTVTPLKNGKIVVSHQNTEPGVRPLKFFSSDTLEYSERQDLDADISIISTGVFPNGDLALFHYDGIHVVHVNENGELINQPFLFGSGFRAANFLIKGNSVVVGNAGTGVIRVYDRLEDGSFKFIQDLTGSTRNGFGRYAAHDDNGHLFVSNATMVSTNGIAHAGRVYVYKRVGDIYEFKTTIHNPDPAVSDVFGSDIRTLPNGNLLVTSQKVDEENDSKGVFYVFSAENFELLHTISMPEGNKIASGWTHSVGPDGDFYVSEITTPHEGVRGKILRFSSEQGRYMTSYYNPEPNNGGAYFGSFKTVSDDNTLYVGHWRSAGGTAGAEYPGHVYQIKDTRTIFSFDTDKNVINYGGSVTLNWSTMSGFDIKLIEIDAKTGSEQQVNIDTNVSSLTFVPQHSAQYKLVASNQSGDVAEESISITVKNFPAFILPPQEFTGTRFGEHLVVLSNGNVAVGTPSWNAGENGVFVYFGDSLELLSPVSISTATTGTITLYDMAADKNGDLAVYYYSNRLKRYYVDIISSEDYQTVKYSSGPITSPLGAVTGFEIINNDLILSTEGTIHKFTKTNDGVLEKTGESLNPYLGTNTGATGYGASISTLGENHLVIGAPLFTGRRGVVMVRTPSWLRENASFTGISESFSGEKYESYDSFGQRVLGLSNGDVAVYEPQLTGNKPGKGKIYIYRFDNKSNTIDDEVVVVEMDSPASRHPNSSSSAPFFFEMSEGPDNTLYVGAAYELDENNATKGAVYQYSLETGELVGIITPSLNAEQNASFFGFQNEATDRYVYISANRHDLYSEGEVTQYDAGVIYRFGEDNPEGFISQLGVLRASQTDIEQNETITLSWTYSGEGQISLSRSSKFSGGPESEIQLATGQKSIDVSPTYSSRYVLTLEVGGQIVEQREVVIDVEGSDTDSDGMPDEWEFTHGFQPLVDDASEDFDKDNLTNLEEYQYNQNPKNRDSDGDGIYDGVRNPYLTLELRDHVDNPDTGELEYITKNVTSADAIDGRVTTPYASLYLKWNRDNGTTHFKFQHRAKGEESWLEEELNGRASGKLFTIYDQQEFEFQVAACNSIKCTDFSVYPYSVKADLPEIFKRDPVRTAAGFNFADGNDDTPSTINYCLADKETNLCLMNYLQVKATLQNDDHSRCWYKNGEELNCNTGQSSSGWYTSGVQLRDSLPIGIHTFYLKKQSSSYNGSEVYARRRFHVYLPVEGELTATPCEISADQTDCIAQLDWSYSGDYPVCLYETSGNEEEELWCDEAGNNQRTESVTLNLDTREFELRAKEPAKERVLATAEMRALFTGVELNPSSDFCGLGSIDDTCDARISWDVNENFNACLFINGKLHICSDKGYVDLPLNIGTSHFELRNGSDDTAKVIAKESIWATYYPSGYIVPAPGAQNPCQPVAGEDSCKVPVHIMHKHAEKGAILYKDGVKWAEFGLSNSTPSLLTSYSLDAEPGGTTWTLHTQARNGEFAEIARLDLFTTTFGSEGYSLTAPEGAHCEYDPTVWPYTCELPLTWELENYDVCLFKVGRDEDGSAGRPPCPDNNLTSGTVRLSDGSHIYQLRKGDEDPNGDLVAQIGLTATEKVLSKISAKRKRCIVHPDGGICNLGIEIFTNEPGNICLYNNDQPVDGACGLHRKSQFETVFVNPGVNSLRLVRVESGGELTELAKTEVLVDARELLESGIDVNPKFCEPKAGDVTCKVTVKWWSNFQTCLNLDEEKVLESSNSSRHLCTGNRTESNPLVTVLELEEGEHTLDLVQYFDMMGYFKPIEGMHEKVVVDQLIHLNLQADLTLSQTVCEEAECTVLATWISNFKSCLVVNDEIIKDDNGLPVCSSDDINQTNTYELYLTSGENRVELYKYVTGSQLEPFSDTLQVVSVAEPDPGDVHTNGSSGEQDVFVFEPMDRRIVDLGNVDAFDAAPANAFGLSINRVDSFKAVDKPVVISLGEEVDNETVTVVIISDDIELNHHVTTSGQAKDILFVSENPEGLLVCNNCSFDNFYRIGMAIVDEPLDTSLAAIGDLFVAEQGRIEITNLQAPGVVSLDILAGKPVLNGVIDLNNYVSQLPNGAYEANPQGDVSVGLSQLNVIVSANIWNYDSRELTPRNVGQVRKSINNGVPDQQVDISGTIKSLGVNIFTSRSIEIDANINTQTDIVSTVAYRGETLVNEEHVSLEGFLDSTLFVKGNIHSQGKVNLRAPAAVSARGDILANHIEVITGGDLFIFGQFDATNIELGARRVINEGMLNADTLVDIYADKAIYNRYGGEIIADRVALQTDVTQESVILNGSRTPWISDPEGLLPIDGSYFADADHTKLGTYYTAGIDQIVNPESKRVQRETHAHIRGNFIHMRSHAVENINPFYEKVLTNEIFLQRKFHSQVSIIGEKGLDIEAQNYIVNASAFMGAESGEVNLLANVFTNERYRIYSIQEVTTETSTNGNPQSQFFQEIEKDILGTRTSVYSPPGILYSQGNLNAKTTGIFLNSVGYIDVQGDFEVETPTIIDAGLQHRQVESSTINNVTQLTHFCDPACVSVGKNLVVANPQQMDSLLSVKGNASAVLPDGGLSITNFTNYKPFEYYLNQVMEEIAERDFGGRIRSLDYYDELGGNLTYNAGFTFDINYDANIFTVGWFEDLTNPDYVAPPPATSLEDAFAPREADGVEGLQPFQRSGEENYSLYSELLNFYNRTKDAFAEFLNEIDWWN